MAVIRDKTQNTEQEIWCDRNYVKMYITEINYVPIKNTRK